MPVRLRYLAHDLEVPAGQFVIGRTPDCQLSLDDPLVSRRHALLVVQTEGVFVEDLGSRNGVFVNGAKIEKSQQLQDGDIIKIGGQEMTLHGVADAVPAPVPIQHRTRTIQDLPAYVERRDNAGEIEDGLTIVTASPLIAANPDRRVSALSLIGGVADKALALGRADEAERILQRALTELLERATSGELLQPDLADRAAGYAARLAGATGKGSWIDYIFLLYTAMRTLPAGRLVDELYSVVRKVKHTDKTVLRAYTNILRELEGGFGPADRFVQQRIEGLERWVP
jgi:hypothetical protein